MNNNLINEEIKKMRMIMGYNRSKTLSENIDMISEITGAGATPPDGTTGSATTGGATTGGATTGGATKTVYKVPSELKSVIDFQNWMVKNGFGSELGPMGADGKYGRYTSAAFAKHKDTYLKKPLPDDEYTKGVDTDPNQLQSDTGTDASNVNQTGNTQQNDAPVPDDIMKT